MSTTWKLGPLLRYPHGHDVYDNEGRHIARISQIFKKNAHLMTAAPELLASVQELESAIRFHFLPLVEKYAGSPAAHAKDDVLDRAIAAIRRATDS